MDRLEATGLARDGSALVLAYDHGLEHGPDDVLNNPRGPDPANIFETATHDSVTALAVQKGLAERYYPDYSSQINLLLKLNGTTNLHDNPPYSAQNCSVERAAELGADAVGYTVYAGSRREDEMLREFGMAQEQARYFDMPAVMWSYPRGEAVADDQDPDVISYAARLGLELGADMVKVKYPGSSDAAAQAAAVAGKTNVVLSGGAKTDDQGFLETVEAVVDAGWSGLAVGRNVWQREDADTFLDALGSIVHDGNTAENAFDML
ncbi:MAG: aldolase [Candidatus Nanohaloarchaea archaeon]|nr:aldolase [Candidatus Nanohaloarchaea archaeon]